MKKAIHSFLRKNNQLTGIKNQKQLYYELGSLYKLLNCYSRYY